MCDLTNPAFTDEDKAREFLESSRWPSGPVCPFCGQLDTVKLVNGPSMGTGWYYCSDCQDKFTVRVGTLYERSHIPLHKWLLASHLMVASKKGMSALQLSRMLGITYKSAWFMCHRIREGMTPATRGPIGGQDRTVEADETVIGCKMKNRAFAKKVPKKHTVLALVDRDGQLLVSRRQCDGQDLAPNHCSGGGPQVLFHHGRTSELQEAWPRVLRPRHRELSRQRVCAAWRFHSRHHRRVPFQTDEARGFRDTPFGQRSPFAPLPCRMGFQVQHPQDELTKPRTLKQRAGRFLRWRKKMQNPV
jgi:transposase-like protein